MLEKSDLLLKISGVVSQSVLFANILAISTAALHVVEVEAVGVKHDLGGVVEEHTSGLVAEVVAKTVLGGVVNPLLDPDLVLSVGRSAIDGQSLGGSILVGSCVPVSGHSVWLAARDDVSLSHRGGGTHAGTGQVLVRALLVVISIVGRQELADIGRRGRAGQSGGRQQSGDGSLVVDPLVRQDLVNRGSLGGIIIQNASNEVTRGVSNGDIFREIVSVHTNALIGGLDIGCFEGRLSNDQGVNDNTERPDIDFIRVTLLALEDFGSNIVGGSANSSLALSVKLQFCGKTEITNFDLHFIVKEEISEFEISVNDTMAVQVLDSSADLVDVALHFQLVETLTTSEELIEGLVLTQLKQNVDILGVFEEVFEADNVVVMQTAMNFDFTHELLLGTRLGESGLGNDLGSGDSLVLEVGEFVTLGESSLTEELALEVLLDADVAIKLDDFLFNNGLCIINLAVLASCCTRWLLTHLFLIKGLQFSQILQMISLSLFVYFFDDG